MVCLHLDFWVTNRLAILLNYRISLISVTHGFAQWIVWYNVIDILSEHFQQIKKHTTYLLLYFKFYLSLFFLNKLKSNQTLSWKQTNLYYLPDITRSKKKLNITSAWDVPCSQACSAMMPAARMLAKSAELSVVGDRNSAWSREHLTADFASSRLYDRIKLSMSLNYLFDNIMSIFLRIDRRWQPNRIRFNQNSNRNNSRCIFHATFVGQLMNFFVLNGIIVSTYNNLI